MPGNWRQHLPLFPGSLYPESWPENVRTLKYLRKRLRENNLHPAKGKKYSLNRNWSYNDLIIRLRQLLAGMEVQVPEAAARMTRMLIKEMLIRGKSMVIKLEPHENLQRKADWLRLWINKESVTYPILKKVKVVTDKEEHTIVAYYVEGLLGEDINEGDDDG